MRRRVLGGTAVAAALVAAAACGGDGEPTLLLGVRAEAPIASLELWTKRYFDDGTTALLERQDLRLPVGRAGYLVGDESPDPLRLRVDLREAGRYAVHVVGVAERTDGEAPRLFADTICFRTSGEHVEDGVVLGALTPDVDADGDTFPEDLAAHCTARLGRGLPCDTACADPSFAALLDCNPAPELVLPDGCGEVAAGPEWHPFVADGCGDCQDRDCFGGDAPCADDDGDGYAVNLDCDDTDPAVHPGAVEVCGNGINDNCAVDIAACADGDVPCDADGDGYLAAVAGLPGCGADCDDARPEVSPAAFEGYGADPASPEAYPGCGNGVDDNCNGLVDERCSNDLDADGVRREDDCDDCNAGVGAGRVERCGDGVDQDCSGADAPCAATDADGDGFAAAPAGEDCDDADGRTYPGAPDRCGDGTAQDCAIDRDCASVVDADGDGFAADVDCDDASAAVNPWAQESCDAAGGDEDCDGTVNEVEAESADAAGCGMGHAGAWAVIDYATDVEHCGGCGQACAVGNAHRTGDECVGGECRCRGDAPCAGGPESYCCPDGCTDIAADPAHCGDCATSCVVGERCVAVADGRVARCSCEHEDGAACDVATANACCAGVGCTSTASDVANCGACGNSCSAGERPRGDSCLAATCRCGTAAEVCTGTAWCTELTEPAGERCGCADLDADRDNCGACGRGCPANEDCVRGACQCPGMGGAGCGGGAASTCCPGVGCVNISSDERHCGACGEACAYGETCEGGVCRCGSGDRRCDASAQHCCSGRCYYVLTDPAHCGPLGSDTACSRACSSGATCSGGFCACGAAGACSAGSTCCDGSYCADLTNDFANCGACRAPCNTGERCVRGTCECDSCFDGDSCTQDTCTHGRRCVYPTLDGDGDGYCSAACPDAASGALGECIDGDCADANGSINPSRTELCNGIDDDCDPASADGVDECGTVGGTPNCCPGVGCRQCCVDAHCTTPHSECVGNACQCELGYFHCEADCDCNYAVGQICCDGLCLHGECCDDFDCLGGEVCCENFCYPFDAC